MPCALKYAEKIREYKHREQALRKLNNLTMKKYKIIKRSTMWSTSALTADVEQLLNEKTQDGYEIVTVAFGINIWMMPTAYITICK
jgi:hypothetical protein